MNFSERIHSLKQAPREVWVICLLKLLTSYGYFSVLAVLVLYLSQEHAFTDQESATLYGMCGLVTALFGIIAGPLIDRLGIRRSIVCGALISSIGMITFALSFNRTTLLIALFLLMPFGVALGLPVLDIGGKRYTFPTNRKIVYSLLYSVMNIGAAIAGVSYDALRYALISSSPDGQLRIHTFAASSERLLILTGACITCISGLIAALAIRDITVLRDGSISFEPTRTMKTNTDPLEIPPQKPAAIRCCYWVRDGARFYWREMLCKRVFWQLVAFTTTLIFVRQIFRQFDTTLPKWTLRVLGSDAPIGSLYAINPTLIVVIAPLIAMCLPNVDLYSMIIGGSLISSLSIFLLAGKATIGSIVIALTIFSVGEAMYSPQTVTIVMAMSAENQEGTYSNLASLPVFISTLLVGIMSGSLMQNYCPAPLDPEDSHGARQCAYIWVVVASVALVTPLLLILFRWFIYTPDVKHAVSSRSSDIKTDEIDLKNAHEDILGDNDNFVAISPSTVRTTAASRTQQT